MRVLRTRYDMIAHQVSIAARKRITWQSQFIKFFVAEKVAKSPAELCQVVVMQLLVITGMRLSSADLTAAIDTASEECQQQCDDNVDQRNDLI